MIQAGDLAASDAAPLQEEVLLFYGTQMQKATERSDMSKLVSQFVLTHPRSLYLAELVDQPHSRAVARKWAIVSERHLVTRRIADITINRFGDLRLRSERERAAASLGSVIEAVWSRVVTSEGASPEDGGTIVEDRHTLHIRYLCRDGTERLLTVFDREADHPLDDALKQ